MNTLNKEIESALESIGSIKLMIEGEQDAANLCWLEGKLEIAQERADVLLRIKEEYSLVLADIKEVVSCCEVLGNDIPKIKLGKYVH